MKMKKYLPVLSNRLSNWYANTANQMLWVRHVDNVKRYCNYSNIEVGLAWDASRLVTTACERSDWIADCDANDSGFTTLAKSACHAVGML